MYLCARARAHTYTHIYIYLWYARHMFIDIHTNDLKSVLSYGRTEMIHLSLRGSKSALCYLSHFQIEQDCTALNRFLQGWVLLLIIPKVTWWLGHLASKQSACAEASLLRFLARHTFPLVICWARKKQLPPFHSSLLRPWLTLCWTPYFNDLVLLWTSWFLVRRKQMDVDLANILNYLIAGHFGMIWDPQSAQRGTLERSSYEQRLILKLGLPGFAILICRDASKGVMSLSPIFGTECKCLPQFKCFKRLKSAATSAALWSLCIFLLVSGNRNSCQMAPVPVLAPGRSKLMSITCSSDWEFILFVVQTGCRLFAMWQLQNVPWLQLVFHSKTANASIPSSPSDLIWCMKLTHFYYLQYWKHAVCC